MYNKHVFIQKVEIHGIIFNKPVIETMRFDPDFEGLVIFEYKLSLLFSRASVLCLKLDTFHDRPNSLCLTHRKFIEKGNEFTKSSKHLKG